MTSEPVAAVVPTAKESAKAQTAKILKFPVKARKRHARTSSGREGSGRAAKRTNRSAVMPAAFALSEASTADHHSSGIRSRCDHLRVAWTGAPISDAIAAGDGQRATMALNEVGSVIIESGIRQIVLFEKAILSHDCGGQIGLNLGVDENDPASAYQAAFIERTRWARRASGLSQDEVAEGLGIEQTRYSKYETRSMLPHEFVPMFCLLTRIDADWLFREKGRAPAASAKPEPNRPRKRRGPPKAA